MLRVVISGPSGSGKGTIVQELIKYKNYKLSISATTRTKRKTEEDGVHYFFKTIDEFKKMIEQDELLEYTEFCGNFYGTPKNFVDKTIQDGFDILLEIEVNGALNIKEQYHDAILIFIIPPTFTKLKDRLIQRNTETTEVINYRLTRAKEELKLFKEYDYIIVNDDLNQAIKQINTIVKAEKLRSFRQKKVIEKMLTN